MKVLLRSATIIDPASQYHHQTVDILINEGTIEKIGSSLQQEEVNREIKLENLHVSRGWFDSSVSFGEPGFEERETINNGLDTAAVSGFTDILLNPNTYPVVDDNAAVTSILSKAKNHAVTLHPLGALTVKSQGDYLAELYDMRTAGAVAFGDYKKGLENPNLLKLALQYTQNFGGLVLSFPQDKNIAGKGLVNENINSTQLGLKGIPALAEELQIARDLAVLEYAGGKLHIPTISTAKAVRLIADAKKKGLDITCSVAIHNLIFTDDALAEFDTNAKVLPPLRTASDIKALLKGLKDGTIDMVTTDHSPIDIEHKKVEFEHALYGTIGLETAFGALNKRMGDVEKTINLLTKGRSRFNIDEPEIKEGTMANLSLFNPAGKEFFKRENIHSTSKNSIFLNLELEGKAYGIISGGRYKLGKDTFE